MAGCGGHGRIAGVLPPLGIELPPEDDDKRVVMKRMASGVTMFWDRYYVAEYDIEREQLSGGYRILLEFFLTDNDVVDAKYAELTG